MLGGGIRIERYFNKSRNARRVATRHDKTALSFLAFVEITSIRYQMRFANETWIRGKPPASASG